MNKYIATVLLSTLWNAALVAADAVCFNYEQMDHLNAPVDPGAIPANNALDNYMVRDHHTHVAALPAHGPMEVRVTLRNGIHYHTQNHNIGGPLTLQEAALLAIRRENIGIQTRFAHPDIIRAISLGHPIDEEAEEDARTALANGGYSSPLAAAIYRLTNPPRPGFPQPNYLIILLPHPHLGQQAHEVVVHMRVVRRVSKNVKELSFNAIENPTFPGHNLYTSLKRRINQQHMGGPLPFSATVLSADRLQIN